MVSNFGGQRSSSAFAHCKWCGGQGCVLCPGERRKRQAAELKQEADRTIQLQGMSAEEIFGELEIIKTSIGLANGFTGIRMSKEEVEEAARTKVLENLARGGHEYPKPQPVFTCDESDEQMAEMVQVFHSDRLQEAVAPGGGGIEGILVKASEVMAKRSEASNTDVDN